jgi:hypothetical protein
MLKVITAIIIQGNDRQATIAAMNSAKCNSNKLSSLFYDAQVGVIIGRTGAQVLQTLLPWISESFSDDEKEAMMDSIRQVTRNTMFDQWLGAVKEQNTDPHVNVGSGGADLAQVQGSGSGNDPHSAAEAVRQEDLRPLTEVAEYLRASTSAAVETEAEGAAVCPHDHRHDHPHPQQQVTWEANPRREGAAGAGAGVDVVSGDVGDAVPLPLDASGTFRPGWEDIFRMNQKQLEAAIHRVSNDASLEPGRKAYLIQNIMVRRYIYECFKFLPNEAHPLIMNFPWCGFSHHVLSFPSPLVLSSILSLPLRCRGTSFPSRSASGTPVPGAPLRIQSRPQEGAAQAAPRKKML